VEHEALNEGITIWQHQLVHSWQRHKSTTVTRSIIQQSITTWLLARQFASIPPKLYCTWYSRKSESFVVAGYKLIQCYITVRECLMAVLYKKHIETDW